MLACGRRLLLEEVGELALRLKLLEVAAAADQVAVDVDLRAWKESSVRISREEGEMRKRTDARDGNPRSAVTLGKVRLDSGAVLDLVKLDDLGEKTGQHDEIEEDIRKRTFIRLS